jgi:hypothetical protein
MAFLLFIDESGHDRKHSPYEVLAGVAIRDADLWPLIQEMHAAELYWFGRRYSDGFSELKGQKLLKTKVFHHTRLNVEVVPHDIPVLAKEALDRGADAQIRHLKGLALAKLGYVKSVFDLLSQYDCKAFCSMVETDARPTSSEGLRKDYAYLFERFFYYLEDQNARAHHDHGIIVFDELDKSKSHLLIGQSHVYFKETATGRHRSSLILPEPLFVHSELTTGIQLADLVAYVVSWGFRTPHMTKPAREELAAFAQQVSRLRFRTVRQVGSNPNFEIWSFAHIADLRTRSERE